MRQSVELAQEKETATKELTDDLQVLDLELKTERSTREGNLRVPEKKPCVQDRL